MVEVNVRSAKAARTTGTMLAKTMLAKTMETKTMRTNTMRTKTMRTNTVRTNTVRTNTMVKLITFKVGFIVAFTMSIWNAVECGGSGYCAHEP